MKKNNIFEHNSRFLESFEREHVGKLKAWRNDQMAVLRQYAPLTDEDQKRWFRFMKGDKNQILFSLHAREGKKQKYIGYCGITNVDYKNKRGEISFIVDSRRVANRTVYRDDFIAVLTMLTRYAFQELNLHKLFTDTFEFRKDHIKILEIFGLRKEGTLRQHYFGKGKYFNSFIHSILKDEWVRIQKKYESKK
ncbi:MAG: GNAT family protein [bacterium]|nr:GNAT family protein [bacterium]